MACSVAQQHRYFIVIVLSLQEFEGLSLHFSNNLLCNHNNEIITVFSEDVSHFMNCGNHYLSMLGEFHLNRGTVIMM